MFLLTTAYLHSRTLVRTGELSQVGETYGLCVQDIGSHWPAAYGGGRHIQQYLEGMHAKFHDMFNNIRAVTSETSKMLGHCSPIERLDPSVFAAIKLVPLRSALVYVTNKYYWPWVEGELAYNRVISERLVGHDAAKFRTFCNGCRDGWAPNSNGVVRFGCRQDCMPFQQGVAQQRASQIRFRIDRIYNNIDFEVNHAPDIDGVDSNPVHKLWTSYHNPGRVVQLQNRYHVFGTKTMMPVKYFQESTTPSLPDADHTDLSVSDQTSIYEAALEDLNK